MKRASIMKISARNVLPGKIVAVVKGTTTANVKIQVAGGSIITSSITNDAVDELDLKVGKEVSAVIKSSDVLVATNT
jgi:molybdopterin-binding protein